MKMERTKVLSQQNYAISCDEDVVDNSDTGGNDVMARMIMKMVMMSMILVVMMSPRQHFRKLDQDSRILAKEEKISENLVLYCV